MRVHAESHNRRWERNTTEEKEEAHGEPREGGANAHTHTHTRTPAHKHAHPRATGGGGGGGWGYHQVVVTGAEVVGAVDVVVVLHSGLCWQTFMAATGE